MDEPQKNGNGASTGQLAKLLNQLNLPTLALILLTGGGNLFVTKNTSEEQKAETQQAIQQINDLHDALRAFESRQKEMLENQAQIIRSQQISIQNQLDVLKKIDTNGSKAP